MKKILAGMFFRLFKSFEIYVLIAVLLVASPYLFYVQFEDDMYVSMSRSDGVATTTWRENDQLVEVKITKDNIKQMQFASMDVSVYDAYRCYTEILPDDVFNALDNSRRTWQSEIEFLFTVLGSLHYLPAILIALFIPLFFGRLFKDGTIKNLLASGHSKGRIYLSCLVMSVILDLFMLLISIGILAAVCAYFLWEPPIYLPIVLTMIGIELMILIVFSAICVAALFITKKITAAIIVGFVVCVFMYFPLTEGVVLALMDEYTMYDSPEYDRFIELYKTEGPNAFNERFDYENFYIKVIYKNEELHLSTADTMPRAEKNILLFMAYTDPFLIVHLRHFGITPYMQYRDGLMALNITCIGVQTVLVSALGIVVFKKKEIA